MICLENHIAHHNQKEKLSFSLKIPGASICISEKGILDDLGLNKSVLIPTSLLVTSGGSSSINLLGALVGNFTCKATKTKSTEIMYICKGTRTCFLSLGACVSLGLIDESFVEPEENSVSLVVEILNQKIN